MILVGWSVHRLGGMFSRSVPVRVSEVLYLVSISGTSSVGNTILHCIPRIPVLNRIVHWSVVEVFSIVATIAIIPVTIEATQNTLNHSLLVVSLGCIEYVVINFDKVVHGSVDFYHIRVSVKYIQIFSAFYPLVVIFAGGPVIFHAYL